MEERRLLLAIALSLVVLTGWRYLVVPPPAPSPAPAPAVSAGTASPAPPRPAPATAPAPARPAAPVPAPEVETARDERERRVELESADVSLAFTNRGARLISWKLKRYPAATGRPEEMVPVAPGGPRPLDLETGDAALDERLREALFQASGTELTHVGAGGASVRFRFAEDDIEAEKELRLEPQGYLVAVSGRVRRAGQPLPVRVVWGPGLGNPSDEEKAVQGYLPPRAVGLAARHVERLPADKLASPRTLTQAGWAGVESLYFAALLIPPADSAGAAELRAVTVGAAAGTPQLAAAAAVFLDGTGPVLVYVGPKDYLALSKLGHGLSRVVDIGDWIGPIVVLLMRLLRFVQGHVGSYGWSIVLLTVLINLVLAPLRHYSIANGMKMAKLAPEMKVIQDRYRGIPALDKRREQMQREMAELYARHGMSMGTQMLVGCLPILLTLPFLFAFYRVLAVSIELRGAPFLWMPDLSHKDPLFLTPLLMGGSMLLMQKLTPSAMDPAQQRMMMIMPLVFMVMFFAAPAGLNLYWLASNVCAIVQQAVTLQILKGSGHLPARAEKRHK